MKVKEIERTANAAWSPASQHPIYLAAGTAAQQLDATFSTSAALELFKLDLSESGLDMAMVGTIPSDHRFQKLVWGSHGMDGETPSGHLVGGTDNGHILVWDPVKIMSEEECVLHKITKHTGAVSALDFNHFQSNLLASGASESEIYIWDLNKAESPMTPGQKSQPADDVTCVAWNMQVQHILASTFGSRCVVWDLRKNEPIIKISDSMSRIKSKLVAWNPEVATQMCLSSEDDHTPVIQLWDLRFATSPLKVLENHQRGILSMAWCPQDPELLMTCGKDNRILCWNPSSNTPGGEVIYELPTCNQWSFDVHWCPRNPAIISTCSFDGHVSIYSLMGGEQEEMPAKDKISDSFPTDPFSQQMAAPVQVQQTVMPLKKAPKWLRKPVGASFGFGGKLVTFENPKPANPQNPVVTRQVYISQVITESDLIARSTQLEEALNKGQFAEFCAMKIANSHSELDENIWSFLKVNFEKEPRTQFLQLLGYDRDQLSQKISSMVGNEAKSEPGINADELSERMADLNADTGINWSEQQESLTEDQSSLFDDMSSSMQDSRSSSPLTITVDNNIDGLISQAVLIGNFEAAVDMCLHDNRMAEAIILAVAGGPELLVRAQKKYFAKQKSDVSRLISSVVRKKWMEVIQYCDLNNWKEALAMILTYSSAAELSQLCDLLGERLESDSNHKLAVNACMCYIVSGNVERLVNCWTRMSRNTDTPRALQDVVEKVMLLRKAVELIQGEQVDVNSNILGEKLSKYAELLAAQGRLSTAVSYLGSSQQTNMLIVKDRLYKALGHSGQPTPFNVVDIKPPGVAPAQPTTAFQSTAKSNFSTTTTSSSYNTSSYSGMVNGAPYDPYTAPAVAANVPSTPYSAKGPLSSKYPAYPQTSNTAYNYSQPGYQSNYDTGYSQSTYSQAYQQPTPYSSAAGYPGQQTGYPQTGPITPPATSVYDPMAPGPGGPYPPQPQNIQPTGPQVPSFQEVKPVQAWNDPPMVSAKSKQTVPSSTYDTNTLLNPLQANPVPTGQTHLDQTPPGGPVNYGMYNPREHQPVAAPAPATQQSNRIVEPGTSIPKAPIPNEHQVLQDIFNKLVNSCLQNARNPQVKRKLEDVARKLEILYDKLRDNTLSQGVILGLHQIIQSIQAYDYQTGIGYHTQLISQGNFSEISAFMPGIKVLMQTAMTMQVFVQ